MLKRLILLFFLLFTCAAPVRTAAPADGSRPRLAVVISIDQFRADYVTRFQDLYLPARRGRQVGGFRYLQTRGAWYADCRYEHHRTVTGAGHAILGSGAQPYLSGIVGNSWFDRASGKSMYCVADAKSQVVGAGSESKATPMSPANLLVTTVGDELEMATGGRARTVSLSFKDRAAILMAGHRADAVIWFDQGTGRWISSSYYCPDGTLPEWVEEWNARRRPDELRREPWTPSVDSAAMERAIDRRRPAAFSYPLTGTDYGPFANSPAGNAFVLETARQAVLAEQLGQDAVPDILSINLATNDYVGHRYGPDSPEVLDLSVQTDRQLAEFFNFLDRTVPGGLSQVVIALSADHGVATVPELHSAAGVPAARAVTTFLRSTAEKALDEAVGAADWIAALDNGELYFGQAALAKYRKEPRERLERIVCDALQAVPGVHLAVGKSAVLGGRGPANALGKRIALGVHPGRSGDVILVLDPHWLPGSAPVGTGTSHGAPFPYDTHVPLLVAGYGVRPGTYGAPVSPARLAPTLAHLLGVARPSGADEPLLPGLRQTR
jgi:arylsulfatase A-like enzyme